MDQEQPTATAQDESTSTQPPQPAAAPVTYDSNPFTTTRTGVQKLIALNAQTSIGVVLFDILLFGLLGFTIIIIALSILAFIVKHVPDFSIIALAYAPPASLSFFSSVSDSSIYATWIIGTALCILIIALIQIMQLHLTISSARGQAVRFGMVLKQSLRSILPILGYIGLAILTLIVATLALSLLSNVLGYITAIIGIICMLAVIFISFRLAFTTYGIVDSNLGPIAAIKQSWSITNGHVIETIGIMSVSLLIFVVPSIILSALARVTQNAAILSGIFSLLQLIVALALILFSTMAIAERYVQLDSVAKKTTAPTSLSPLNFLAVVIVILLIPVLNSLSPRTAGLNGTDPFNTMNNSNQDPNTLPAPTSLN
jgi:hypothetical protein